MRSLCSRRAFAMALALAAQTGLLWARELAFEERVKAQEAIERVCYLHQIGATQPFERAVPRKLLESKVRDYLVESAALESAWHSPVTDESLRREEEPIARNTHMPRRLLELYAALNSEPALIMECPIRPVLIHRLTRTFFDYDAQISFA